MLNNCLLDVTNDQEVVASGRFAIEIAKATTTTSIDDAFAHVMIWDVDGTIVVDPSMHHSQMIIGLKYKCSVTNCQCTKC